MPPFVYDKEFYSNILTAIFLSLGIGYLSRKFFFAMEERKRRTDSTNLQQPPPTLTAKKDADITGVVTATYNRSPPYDIFEDAQGATVNDEGDDGDGDDFEGDLPDEDNSDDSADEDSSDDESVDEESSEEKSSEEKSSEEESPEEESKEKESTGDQDPGNEGPSGKRTRHDSKSYDDESSVSKKRRYACDNKADDVNKAMKDDDSIYEPDNEMQGFKSPVCGRLNKKRQDFKSPVYDKLNKKGQDFKSPVCGILSKERLDNDCIQFCDEPYSKELKEDSPCKDLNTEFLPLLTVPLEFIYQILPLNM